MDAVEFIRERNRMCKHFRGCNQCPADGMICSTIWEMNDAERLVQIVEEWAKEHPHKTRQRKFLEQWPTAKIDKSGYLDVCPYTVSATHDGGCVRECTKCQDCRREFWMQEVE